MEHLGVDRLMRPRPRRPRAGSLLVSAPSLLDPNFRRTVVLLLQHDDDGSAGVVLNRDSPLTAADLGIEGAENAAVREGGPVAADSVLGLAPIGSVSGRRVAAGLGIAVVDLDGLGPDTPGLIVFVGHAGWGRGQLADEIARDDWHVVPADAGDVLALDPASVWPRVLRRQPDTTRLWATLPEQPSAN